MVRQITPRPGMGDFVLLCVLSRKRKGIISDWYEACLFVIHSLTPPQEAGNALAVRFSGYEIEMIETRYGAMKRNTSPSHGITDTAIRHG